MIVVGVDVHKQSLTAVAVDEVGRPLSELTVGSAEELLVWSSSLAVERLWALEDCRQLTRGLEQRLQAAGERLVRVPPKLMAPSRRRGRIRGKSDPIDALAVARAALREPRLDHPRPGEAALRELKLLVDHRDDLVDERRRAAAVALALARARPAAGGPGGCARPDGLAREIQNSHQRRPARPPRRRRPAASQQRQAPPPPARPRQVEARRRGTFPRAGASGVCRLRLASPRGS